MTDRGRGIILLPDRFRDPHIFERVIVMQDEILSNGYALDLSRVAFIEPYSMLSLLILGRNYFRARGERLELANIPVHIYQYLSRMDFFKNEIFTVPEIPAGVMALNRSGSSRKLVEITVIPGRERESVRVISSLISLFRKRASGILKYWMSESVVDYFVTVISELCQNIFEHSMDTGYLAMQTYSYGNENIARLVISDSGIGIKKSFEGMGNLAGYTGAELIELALTTTLSSKREFGYGLYQVNSIVEKLKGILFIRSGESSLTALHHRKEGGTGNIFHRNGLADFQGTQISISLSA